MMSYIDPPEAMSCSSISSAGRTSPAAPPPTGCYGRPDPQIVHVRVSPPESSLSLAEGQTSQDTEARGDQKKEQQAIPHRWQLTPQDEKTQALFNFNETALPPKSEFYPADENISEKLKLLYGESKVSPCCQKCSPCCCSCCVIQ
ncbi:uncharacterized protein LOC118416562 isoform X2 [Branchiostoma floridae]|uniref:Uncharacterized protein LOC118416562 isoform X2 n=1 Tax=Branchiostoma floridae TaxID=7739 RepID=A0A9J7MSV5_BRAFL|nr:uncharacterized protein LOC118416562 isoform X2 [Branchiostoma floridae]